MKVKHVVSFSGGKDSTALLLLALNRCPKGSVVPIFCDTGHEHPQTYEYIKYVEGALGIEIVTLRARFEKQIAKKRMFIARDQRNKRDKHGRRLRWSNKAKRRALSVLRPTGNPYLDLCMLRGRFPQRKAQFCTEELKRAPAIMFQLDLIDSGYNVISWQGVRRDESASRRNAPLWSKIGPNLYAFRPLVDWSSMDVISFVQSRGVDLNPLYSQGMTRVGCMPCINANKKELKEIATRFPEEIARVACWENIVAKASKPGKTQPFFIRPPAGTDAEKHRENGIWEMVEWAKTTRGGRQYDLLAESEPIACASAYGLCE